VLTTTEVATAAVSSACPRGGGFGVSWLVADCGGGGGRGMLSSRKPRGR